MMPAQSDPLDARFILADDDHFPPLLYLSPEPGDMRLPALQTLLRRMGIPPLASPAAPSVDLPAAPDGWQIVIGPGRGIAVWMPPQPGAPRALVEGIGYSTPPGWRRAAAAHGQVLVFVGPARPFVPGNNGSLAGFLRGLENLDVVAAAVAVASPPAVLPPGLRRG